MHYGVNPLDYLEQKMFAKLPGADDPAYATLALQLGFDDLMFWSFGDNGDDQFWISPEDLARRNWDGVTLSFECH